MAVETERSPNIHVKHLFGDVLLANTPTDRSNQRSMHWCPLKEVIRPGPMQQHGQLPNIHSTRDESVAEFALNDHEAGNSMEEKDLSIVLVNHPMPREVICLCLLGWKWKNERYRDTGDKEQQDFWMERFGMQR